VDEISLHLAFGTISARMKQFLGVPWEYKTKLAAIVGNRTVEEGEKINKQTFFVALLPAFEFSPQR
jgi:hypothetical protein